MVLFTGLALTLAGCGGAGSDTADTSSDLGTDQAQTGTQAPSESGVAPTGNRTAVLSWSAPSTRVNGDGISMGELDSYVIRYGRDQENLSAQVEVPGAQEDATMEYVVDNLDQGTWYFTVQVRDSGGLLSSPSAMVSKTI